MNDERKTTIEVNMTDDEWIELLCLCEDINLTPEDLAVAFCQEVIRQQALLRIIAAAIRSDMAMVVDYDLQYGGDVDAAVQEMKAWVTVL